MARIIPARYTLAIVLFILVVFIVLTIGAIRLFGSTPPSIQRYPPWLSQCPDYWTNNGDGTCTYNAATPNGKPTCSNGDDKNLHYTQTTKVPVNKYSWKDLCNWCGKRRPFSALLHGCTPAVLAFFFITTGCELDFSALARSWPVACTLFAARLASIRIGCTRLAMSARER